MSVTKRTIRYAANLLFQYRVQVDGVDSVFRTTERRIVVLKAVNAIAALRAVNKRAKRAEHSFLNDDGSPVFIEFIGIIDLISLDPECEADEVWYEIREQKTPMERRSELVPRPEDLSAVRQERLGR